MPPEVSVLMPVYNQERLVVQAVQSILDQTFSDYELLALDDGSTDRTLDVLHGIKDPRLRVIPGDHMGFVGALRRGLAAASGRWIARMDSDDVARHDRLATQVEYLRAHPGCVLVASVYGLITPNEKYLAPETTGGWRLLEPADVTLARFPFADPSQMFDRAKALEEGYDERWENEKPLLYKLMRRGTVALCMEPLMFLRWRIGSFSRGQFAADRQVEMNTAVRLEFDPENAQKTSPQRPDPLSPFRRGVDVYAAAGDHKAARAAASTLFRAAPFRRSTLRALATALGIRKVRFRGPGGVRYRRTVIDPVWSRELGRLDTPVPPGDLTRGP